METFRHIQSATKTNKSPHYPERKTALVPLLSGGGTSFTPAQKQAERKSHLKRRIKANAGKTKDSKRTEEMDTQNTES
ncbi:hypothetical protein DPMN_160207 [Dreissena polymorpha]|uniref:Uncharacterized protein n=1 Tax=Dreissena polymorpha TaxID=45954 RepID=A0A9D4EMS7_DREPO|nr:hypothetical protein DPMN_160207 [Dreissena polymorpha]